MTYLAELIKHIEEDLAHRNMIRVKAINSIKDLEHQIAEVDTEIAAIEKILIYIKDAEGVE